MVSFDLGFISMFVENIVEDEVSLWTEGGISWLSINRGYSQGKRVHIVNGDFRPCIGVLSGAAYRWGHSFERLVAF